MKQIFFFFVFIFLMLVFASCRVKQRMADISMQKEIAFPILIDSTKFQGDLASSGEIEKLYHLLKNNGWPYTYKYYFTVNKDGKVKGDSKYLDNEARVRNLNEFFMNVFDKYHWASGHEKECQGCKVTCYGIVNIYFKVPQNKVEVEISMFDGTTSENPQNNTIYRVEMSL